MASEHIIIIDLQLCFECGAPPEQMHHVMPKSRGGTRMVPLCGVCHGLVHDTNMSSAALIKEGLARHRQTGGHTGQLPYGMVYTDQVSEQGHRIVAAVPGELVLLDAMRTMRLEGATYREIAEHLNNSGHQTRQGRSWTEANVGRILRRLTVDEEQT